jgi:origin recognition complex subunit 3
LRSGDSSNLKAILKKLIREARSQKPGLDEDEELSLEQDVGSSESMGIPLLTDQGRKLLNYDLEILHGFVKTHGSQSAVVAFQDSEAFDTTLLVELIILFKYAMAKLLSQFS